MDPVLNDKPSVIADAQEEAATKNLVREAVNRLGRRWGYVRGTTEPSVDPIGCLELDLPSVQVHEDRMKSVKR